MRDATGAETHAQAAFNRVRYGASDNDGCTPAHTGARPGARRTAGQNVKEWYLPYKGWDLLLPNQEFSLFSKHESLP